jgi:hypothetical protein
VLFTPTRGGTARTVLTMRGDGNPLSIPLQRPVQNDVLTVLP